MSPGRFRRHGSAELPFESEIKELIGSTAKSGRRKPTWRMMPIRSRSCLSCGTSTASAIATPKDWQPHVRARLQTETGKAMAEAVSAARREAWWWDAAASREADPEDPP